MPATPADAEPLELADLRAWSRWLAKHHAKSDGVWLRIAKAGAPTSTILYPQALEEALCWGWIDGQKKGGEPYWLQRFTPRRARSIWSKVNCAKALALIEQGRMQAAGLAEVERAKADGRWERAYDSPGKSTVPPDLQAALDANPKALKMFATLNSANRYAVLWRVQTAKRAETRAKRIAMCVGMLEKGEVFHP